MRLEQQVCSLELAKRLKELDVSQSNQFYWFGGSRGVSGGFMLRHKDDEPAFFEECYPAFTVAELGEMLPLDVNIPLKGGRKRKGPHRITYAHWESGWKCGLNHATAQFYMNIVEATEANARAKMLIYLIENKLITVP